MPHLLSIVPDPLQGLTVSWDNVTEMGWPVTGYENFWEDPSFIDRFWKGAFIGDPDECWPWQRSLIANRYGATSYKSRLIGAHVASYTLTHGPVTKGLYVLHKCDNPICINPRHLFAGTQLDNLRDCSRKGRLGGAVVQDRNGIPKSDHHREALRTSWTPERKAREAVRMRGMWEEGRFGSRKAKG